MCTYISMLLQWWSCQYSSAYVVAVNHVTEVRQQKGCVELALNVLTQNKGDFVEVILLYMFI